MSSKKPKAPEIRARAVFPVLESIGQVSAMLCVPESLVKTAKRKGCKAFLTHGRVDLGILVPFLFQMIQAGSEIPEGFSSWKEVLEAEKAKREAIKRQEDERSLMSVADAERQAASAMALTFAELDRRDRELPPALAGLPAVEIFKRMTADTESIRKVLKTKFEEIGK